MRPSRHSLVGFLLALTLVLGACGTQSSPNGSLTLEPAQTDVPSPTATVVPETSPFETPAEPQDVTVYTVLAGDTLASIARRFATSVEQLLAWNAARYPSLASEPGTLLVGWELVVAD